MGGTSGFAGCLLGHPVMPFTYKYTTCRVLVICVLLLSNGCCFLEFLSVFLGVSSALWQECIHDPSWDLDDAGFLYTVVSLASEGSLMTRFLCSPFLSFEGPTQD